MTALALLTALALQLGPENQSRVLSPYALQFSSGAGVGVSFSPHASGLVVTQSVRVTFEFPTPVRDFSFQLVLPLSWASELRGVQENFAVVPELRGAVHAGRRFRFTSGFGAGGFHSYQLSVESSRAFGWVVMTAIGGEWLITDWLAVVLEPLVLRAGPRAFSVTNWIGLVMRLPVG